MSDRRDLTDALIEAEGTGPMQGGRHLPYLDCCGKFWRRCACAKKGTLTIGYGTNLDVGITPRESGELLEHRQDEAVADLSESFSWFARLDGVRMRAVAELRFNLGAGGFRGFKKMLAAFVAKDYPAAASELRDSKWIGQVPPSRSVRLLHMILMGTDL